MNKVPAHKSGTAGQIVNNVGDTEEMLYSKTQYTLGDYIQRAQEHEKKLENKKLTFEEWYIQLMKKDGHNSSWYNKDVCRMVWKAAQENK